MAKFEFPDLPPDDVGPEKVRRRRSGPPPRVPAQRPPLWASLVGLGLVLLIGYLVYLWFFVRVVVGPGEVLVLLKKDGSRSLEGDQIVIPAPPEGGDAEPGTAEYQEWEKRYADWQARYEDANGILEQVYKEGTYFSFSPFDYEREVHKVAEVPSAKVGIVVRKFGQKLPAGQVLAKTSQRGPLPGILQPGRYPDYSNPYAYEIKLVDPVEVDPGHRGVVTIMAGKLPANPNHYLVQAGEQGVQQTTEPEGFLYINPFEKRVTPISVQSQRFELRGEDAIQFPSKDSFDIRMEGFVEWRIKPENLPLTYVQYGEGGGLLEYIEQQVILPYSRSYSRLVGSQYTARDFISGDTKLKFQDEFERQLRDECRKRGIEVIQALVRDIVPPDAIKNPINEREIAKQQIRALEQQIQVAKSQAELAREMEMAKQNQKIGDANKEVVTIVKQAEQQRDVAITLAKQELEVAKLHLEAARKQADALLAKGKAEANVVLLRKQAEAEPLRQQVAAFGDGNGYAQYFFYQQVAPSIQSILTNTDGPFAELFLQFANKPARAQPSTEAKPVVQTETGVQ